MLSHYVATSYVYDRIRDSFLFVLHQKLQKWLPPGGHLNDGEMPHKGALREMFEEIGVYGKIIDIHGIANIGTSTTQLIPAPFCILHETVPAESEGEEHIHIDFNYIVEINLSNPLILSEKEILDVKWVSINQIELLDTYISVKQVCQAISNIFKERAI